MQTTSIQQANPMPAADGLRFPARRGKGVFLLLVSLAFVAAGLKIKSQDPWLGWIGVVFFGLGVPASFALFWPGATYLQLDAKGIVLCAMFRKHRRNWADIADFRMGNLGADGGRVIEIVYAPHFREHRAVRALASSMSGMEAAIMDSYDKPLEEILAALNAWKARFDATSPRPPAASPSFPGRSG